jgi:putative oxidoreductase
MQTTQMSGSGRALFSLRLLLGALFIAHLYWKLAVLPGGVQVWRDGLIGNGYPSFVPYYVLSAEFAGALLIIPGIFARYVSLYAIPMMIGAAQFWLVRNGFYFTKGGAELPLVWLALLGIQAIAGDGPYALVRSPDWRRLAAGISPRRSNSPARTHGG